MKKGFTLVELSIVLVIIGLLIGGILVAQSMIETVKIQNIARKLQQFDIAVSNFQTKYQSIPGDAIAFGGNGDGKLNCYENGEKCADDITPGFNTYPEATSFWMDLQIAGFDLKNLAVPTLDLGRHEAVFGNRYTAMDGTEYNVYFVEVVGQNKFVTNYQVSMIQAVASATDYHILKPSEALALDMKIDDGKPYTGVVQHNWDGYWFAYPNDGCDDFAGTWGDDPSGANYDVSQGNNQSCALTVGMLGGALPPENAGP